MLLSNSQTQWVQAEQLSKIRSFLATNYKHYLGTLLWIKFNICTQ